VYSVSAHGLDRATCEAMSRVDASHKFNRRTWYVLYLICDIVVRRDLEPSRDTDVPWMDGGAPMHQL
jgi:hypothetical protein